MSSRNDFNILQSMAAQPSEAVHPSHLATGFSFSEHLPPNGIMTSRYSEDIENRFNQVLHFSLDRHDCTVIEQ